MVGLVRHQGRSVTAHGMQLALEQHRLEAVVPRVFVLQRRAAVLAGIDGALEVGRQALAHLGIGGIFPDKVAQVDDLLGRRARGKHRAVRQRRLGVIARRHRHQARTHVLGLGQIGRGAVLRGRQEVEVGDLLRGGQRLHRHLVHGIHVALDRGAAGGLGHQRHLGGVDVLHRHARLVVGHPPVAVLHVLAGHRALLAHIHDNGLGLGSFLGIGNRGVVGIGASGHGWLRGLRGIVGTGTGGRRGRLLFGKGRLRLVALVAFNGFHRGQGVHSRGHLGLERQGFQVGSAIGNHAHGLVHLLGRVVAHQTEHRDAEGRHPGVFQRHHAGHRCVQRVALGIDNVNLVGPHGAQTLACSQGGLQGAGHLVGEGGFGPHLGPLGERGALGSRRTHDGAVVGLAFQNARRRGKRLVCAVEFPGSIIGVVSVGVGGRCGRKPGRLVGVIGGIVGSLIRARHARGVGQRRLRIGLVGHGHIVHGQGRFVEIVRLVGQSQGARREGREREQGRQGSGNHLALDSAPCIGETLHCFHSHLQLLLSSRSERSPLHGLSPWGLPWSMPPSIVDNFTEHLMGNRPIPWDLLWQ